jgi:hypothetical protein
MISSYLTLIINEDIMDNNKNQVIDTNYQEAPLSQRQSFKDKIADDYAWAKRQIRHIIQYYGPFAGNNYDNYKRKLSNYKFYNNELDYEDLKYECSLINVTKETFHDIITPLVWSHNIVNVLLGENDNKPFNHKAILLNSSGMNAFKRQKSKMLQQYLEQSLGREIEAFRTEQMENNPPQLTGNEEQDQQIQQEYEQMLAQQMQRLEEARILFSPQDIEKYMLTWQDEREIACNKLLSYYKRKLNLKDKKSDGFKHGKIAGEEYAWIGIVNDEPVVKLLNPLNVFFHKSPDSKFIQNGSYAGYVEYMSVSDVLSTFELSEEQVTSLEQRNSLRGSYGTDVQMAAKNTEYKNEPFEMRWMRNYNDEHAHIGAYGQGTMETLIRVVHVEWRSQKRVGFIDYVDEFGELQTEMVSEEFKTPKGNKKELEDIGYGRKKHFYYFEHEVLGSCKLEWKWIDEIWEGVEIDQYIYTNMAPKKLQYRQLEDPNSVKLGFHGVVYNNLNSAPVSTMDRAKPFNLLYIMVAHKMKHMIALDKPPLTNIDVDELPDNMDKKEFIHFMDTMGIKFTQRLKHADNPAAANLIATTASGTQPRSTLQYVINYYQVLNYLKQDIMSIAGVSPERMAQTSMGQSVTNAQQNLNQSAHITDYEFKIHNLHWSELLNTLIETVLEHLRTTDKKLIKRFLLDDGTLAALEIDPTNYANSDIGIFTTDTGKEEQIFSHLKDMSHALIQTDKINLTTLTSMLEADSLSELKKLTNEYEKQREKQQQAMQQSQQEHERQMSEMQLESREDQQAHEVELQHMRNEVEIYKAQVGALRFNNEITPSEVQGFVDAEQKRVMDYQIAQEDRLSKQQENQQERMVKMKEQDVRLKTAEIAADAKIKAEKIKLANPTAGEKPNPSKIKSAKNIKLEK